MDNQEIDWSKAPEGAMYAMVADFESNAVKRRRVEFMYSEEEANKFRQGNGVWIRHDRPATWTGSGLPPVGTVCEVDHDGWRRCEVIAHAFEGQCSADALFTYIKDDGMSGWNWYSSPDKFRPLRTPEQIAAEEREKQRDFALNWMTAHGSAKGESEAMWQQRLLVVREMLDMGFRKPEAKE